MMTLSNHTQRRSDLPLVREHHWKHKRYIATVIARVGLCRHALD